MKALQTLGLKAMFFGIVLVLVAMFAFVKPSHGFELRSDGSMVLLPQERALLEQCKAAGGGCFIVSREVVERYAQSVAESAVQELQAEVAEKFDAAVKAQAKQVCKNTI